LEGILHQSGQFALGHRQLNADLRRGSEQALNMLLDENHLPVISSHEIETAVSPQQAEVVDGEHRFRIRHEFSVHVIDIRHGLPSPHR
jgi:hypothetical protein